MKNCGTVSLYLNIHLRLLLSFKSKGHVLACVKDARPGQRLLDNVNVVVGVSPVPSGRWGVEETSPDHGVSIILEMLNDLLR